ncbi:MAG: ATP-binding protein [Verrucomicrobia bacterium]|nr:ATP-binding protein [Verrucomicrobiota bacterium]
MTPSSTLPALQHRAPTGEPGGWQPLENPAAGAAATLAAVASEVDAILATWRERVLRVLLAVYSTIMLVPLSALVAGRVVVVPWPLRAVCVLLYLVMLLATLRTRLELRTRLSIFLAVCAGVGAIQLAVGQLAGHGRISLLIVPLLALLLAGPQAGWLAAGLCALLFAIVPLLLHYGLLADLGESVAGVSSPPTYWALQWLLWLISGLILMILFTRFQTLQRRTMIAERMALRQLEVETADRQRLEEELSRLGDDERRRLGAELHDGLCQHLTAALLNCLTLENQRRVAGADDTPAVTKIRVALQDAIGLAYDVAQGLCPVAMDPDGLLPALEGLCREARDHHGIACDLRANHELAIQNPEHALHLYRIAREAVTNSIKHARCSRVAITLEQHAGAITLQIADDGQAAVPGAVPVAGLGLSIMTYRAKLIGGTLWLAADANGGMRVTCRLPGPEVAP